MDIPHYRDETVDVNTNIEHEVTKSKDVPVHDPDLPNKFEVEIEDDTPPADQGRKPLPRSIKRAIEHDDEEDTPRVKELRKAWHDERRAKEKADRERNAAIEYARAVQLENERHKSTLNYGEELLTNSFKGKAEADLALAEKAYRDAYNDGDTDKLLDAQKKYTEAQINLDKVTTYAQSRPKQQPQAPQQPYSPPQEQPLDNRVQKWVNDNPWFKTDEEMTAIAMLTHNRLVSQHGEGYTKTEDYYTAIDNAVRNRFPEKFASANTQTNTQEVKAKPAQVVSGVTRTRGGVKVKLTTSQQAIAKRLGISNEDYAREYYKLNRN